MFEFQYRFKLYQLVLIDNGEEPNGNPIPPTEDWQFVCDCRDEVNTKAGFLPTADGGTYVFQALIQCPEGTPSLKPGTDIEVRDGSNVRLKQTVKNCDVSLFHTRIWV